MDAVKVHKTYSVAERPDVEVEVDGTWFYGELRQWLLDDAGDWHADVKWHAGPGENRIDTFPADKVRPHPEGSYPPSDGVEPSA